MFGAAAQPDGLIAFYGLQEWWLTSLTADEQKHICATFQPLSFGSERAADDRGGLVTGQVSSCSQSAIGLLQSLSGWFNNKADRPLAKKLLEKAVAIADDRGGDVIDRHFLYQAVTKTYYPDRNSDPSALERAIAACRAQIQLAPEAAKAFQREYKGARFPAITDTISSA